MEDEELSVLFCSSRLFEKKYNQLLFRKVRFFISFRGFVYERQYSFDLPILKDTTDSISVAENL